MAEKSKEPSRFKDLLSLLDGLCALNRDLERAIVEKIEAMRRADMPAMEAAVGREKSIVERLHEREGLRKQLMDAMGMELGLRRGEGRRLTVSKLAEKLPDSSRLALWQTATALRRAVAGSAQANRVAASAVRTLLHHMQSVFAAIRPVGSAPLNYTQRGQMAPRGGTVIMETVG